jgi:eukaryotic-like serine/threonine-protein kinase
MSLDPGTKLGRYEIRAKLGAGGMGEVYLAYDTKLDRKAALKILPADVAANRGRMSRFVQEAKSASALNHPNIITIYEIEHIDSVNFIATEFIDGQTLRERMRRAPMKLSEVLDVAAQIASALSAAHAAGIIHRDIKSDNIMLRGDGLVKVLDFGLAKLAAVDASSVDTEASTRFKTDPGTVVGTAVYMSPEQARGLNLDTRTDIFSLGVVLYEMVTGRLPFDGSTASEVIASILSEKEPQPLARYSREVPPELERIVSKGLRKNRDERYQTIKDMLLDLQTLKQQLEFERKLERSLPLKSQSQVGTEQPGEVETVMHSAVRPTFGQRGPRNAIDLNQRSIVIAVAALLVIALAAGGYFYFTRPRIPAIESIAVLPFVNETGNSDMEYLSAGMAESLITSLSQLPGVSVKGRSSVAHYKGKDASPRQVGKELNVQAIVTGRVSQHGDNFTLHLELVSVNTETVLWSENYNAPMTNLVSLPGEIARDVSAKLRLRLSGTDKQRLAKDYTANTEAYQLYLKGRYLVNKSGSPAEVEKGIESFTKAIEIDPSYALAYAGLADAYVTQVRSGSFEPKQAMPQARAAALKAIALDESLAEAHVSLAIVEAHYDWNWADAEKEYQRAITLNPSYPEAHHWYGWDLSSVGRFDEALAEMTRAEQLDPLSLFIMLDLGETFYYARQYDQTIKQCRKMLDLDPVFPFTPFLMARAYTQKAIYQEAIAVLQEALARQRTQARLAVLGNLHAVLGERDQARKILGELNEQAKEHYVNELHFALIYIGLGEKNQAFIWLEKAYGSRPLRLIFLKVDPAYDSLRSDPRFDNLVRRIGIPQ